jgi:hypothetical protein
MMKWFRIRLSSLLWLVVLAAVFLAGVRYGEHRAATRAKPKVRRIASMRLEVAEQKIFPNPVPITPATAR